MNAVVLLGVGAVLHESGAQLACFVNGESGRAGEELLQKHAGAE